MFKIIIFKSSPKDFGFPFLKPDLCSWFSTHRFGIFQTLQGKDVLLISIISRLSN